MRLLIVWHSATGGTQQMAAAAAEAAAQEPDVTVSLLPAPRAGVDDLIAADGYLFATPENLGAMSGLMKDFFDRTYYPALNRINGRPYASLVCAGTDGNSAAREISRVATGWRLRAIADPLIIRTGAQATREIMAPKSIAADDLEHCRTLGAAIAAGIALGIY